MTTTSHSSPQSSSQSTPGNLFANIPGILGYHPQESILFFLFRNEPSPSPCDEFRYELGPVLRGDIHDIESIAGMLYQAASFVPDLVFAAIISESMSETDARTASSHIHSLADDISVPLVSTWFLPELYSGAAFTLVGGESESSLGPHTSGKSEWNRGKVGNILRSNSMAGFRNSGDLPASSREESFEYLNGANPFQEEKEAAQLSSSASQHARALVSSISQSSPVEAAQLTDALLDDWEELLDTIIEFDWEVEEIMADQEFLRFAAVYYAHTKLRDCIFRWAFTELAAALFRLSIAVARSASGTTKSNALCAAAIAVSSSGPSHRMTQTIQLAVEHDCSHSMTQLLAQAMSAGGLHLITSACEQGSLQAIEQLERGNSSRESTLDL